MVLFSDIVKSFTGGRCNYAAGLIEGCEQCFVHSLLVIYGKYRDSANKQKADTVNVSSPSVFCADNEPERFELARKSVRRMSLTEQLCCEVRVAAMIDNKKRG